MRRGRCAGRRRAASVAVLVAPRALGVERRETLSRVAVHGGVVEQGLEQAQLAVHAGHERDQVGGGVACQGSGLGRECGQELSGVLEPEWRRALVERGQITVRLRCGVVQEQEASGAQTQAGPSSAISWARRSRRSRVSGVN